MIVLDAAALVDVVLDQPNEEWVLDQISGEDVAAPAHQPAEVLSAVTRFARAGEITPEEARDALAEAMALPQTLVPPTTAQLRRAFDQRARIRVLDGIYVAVAQEMGVPMVTTDDRLRRADPPCEVRMPG